MAENEKTVLEELMSQAQNMLQELAPDITRVGDYLALNEEGQKLAVKLFGATSLELHLISFVDKDGFLHKVIGRYGQPIKFPVPQENFASSANVQAIFVKNL